MLRPAKPEDISRIAEILIFAKRMAYRPIFQNDRVSFNEMQVLPLAAELETTGVLRRGWVDEGGMIGGGGEGGGAEGGGLSDSLQLISFFVDPFFQQMGYGRQMMEQFIREASAAGYKQLLLWVLEKNDRARRFYENAGFIPDGARKLEEGTLEYILRYRKKL